MANIVGKVAVLEGYVFVRTQDGYPRRLKLGDPVYENEVIISASNSRVELAFDGGRSYLIPEKEIVTLDASVFGDDLPGGREAAIFANAADTDAVARSIAAGNSLDNLLEETAAGLTGGAGDDGHGFVRLLRIVESVPPLSYEFGTERGYILPELLGGGGFPDVQNTPPGAASDSATTPVNTPVTGNVLGNDYDPRGNTLGVTGFSIDTNGDGTPETFTAGQTATITGVGTLTIETSGAYAFAPVAGYIGPVPVATYTEANGNGDTASSTLTITVAPPAPPTVTIPDTNGVAAGDTTLPETAGATAGSFTIGAPAGLDHISVGGTAVTLAQLGSLGTTPVSIDTGEGTLVLTGYNPATGVVSYSYDPNVQNHNGPVTDSIPVIVSDVLGHNSPADAIDVVITDSVPVAQNDAAAIAEDATPNTVTGNVLTGAGADTVGADANATPVTPATVTLAHGSLVLNGDGSYTYTLNNADPAVNALNTGDSLTDSYTYTLTDGDGTTTTATLTVTIAGRNDAPLVVGSTVGGVEDTPVVLTWANFGISDVDSPTITSVTISSLPADGRLQFYNGSTWANVTAGQSVSKGDVDAGNLRFVPDANEAGGSVYTTSGLGDQHADYARFQVSVTDSSGVTAMGNVTVDIAPVVDPVTLVRDTSSTGSVPGGNSITPPASVGLGRDFFDNITTLASGPSSTDSDVMEAGIESASPTSTGTVTNVGVAGIGDGMHNVPIAVDDAYEVSGLMYMEAGRTYIFSGFVDDSVRLEIGGETLVSGRWGSYATNYNYDGAGHISGASFTPTETGYYTVDLFLYNTDGPNGYDINVSVDGGAAVDLSSANFHLYTGINDVDAAGGQHSAFIANAATGEGGYYPAALNSGLEDTAIKLSALTPTFGDTIDNSESHVVTLSGIPVGAVIGDGTHTFTASAGNTSVTIWNEDNPGAAAGGSNWNLATLAITPPRNYNGSFTLTATATATEIATGATANATTTLSVNVVPVNDAPVVGVATATVSEEGLAGGLADASGTPADTTNATVASGTLSISDVDSSGLSVTLTAPATMLTSGGQTVTWTGGTGGTDLVGSAGGAEVLRVHLTSAGAYTVTLSKPVDHAAAGGEDIKTLNVGVSVSDGATSTASTLTVNIEDDSPNVASPHQAATLMAQDTNVMVVLDVSGSMGDTVSINGTSMTRLAVAVQAINQLLDSYDAFGNVAVRLVTFSVNAQAVGATWTTVAAAKASLASLVASGGTNYDEALGDAITAFGSAGKIAGAQNVSYFLSDGLPTLGSGTTSSLVGTNPNSTTPNANGTGWDQSGTDTGIQATEEATWTTFVNDNNIKSFAVGMGPSINSSNSYDGQIHNSAYYLDPIAYNGTGAGSNIGSLIVTDWSQLSAQLQATLVTPTAGQLLTGTVLGAATGAGADGGYVDQIVIDGVTYTFNQAAHTITTSNGSTPVFNNATDVLTVTTSHGGIFAVDLGDGAYTYSAPAGMTSAFTENIGVRLHDADGDLASGTLYLDVARAQGGVANDTITGTAGSDLIIGGAGNDTMTGLAGSDTFRWVLGDQGSTGTPAQDTVRDFNSAAAASGGDILDLRDLLVGESHAGTDSGNLANYLHFSYDSGTNATTVNVSSHAAGVDQVITLQGVNLIGSLSTDQAVIQDLLNKGKLIAD